MRNTIYPRLALGLTLVFLGCPSGNDDDAGDDDSSGDDGTIEQSQVCADYLECAEVVTPSAMETLLEAYGPDGTCWDSQEAADLCDEACGVAMAELLGQHPATPECMGDGDLTSLAVLGSGAEWRWEDRAYCDLEAYILLTTMYGTEDLSFTMDVELIAHSSEFAEEWTGRPCTMNEDHTFSCNRWWGNEYKYDFEGTFSSHWKSAEAVLTEHEDDWSDSCEFDGNVD